jgi:hypothetical protein
MKNILARILLSVSAVVGFDAITAENASQVAVAENQLFLDVTDAGAGNVLFLFSNIGPIASFIAQIYFNDDLPLYSTTAFTITNGTGVSFVQDLDPDALPGGNGFGFGPHDTLEFEADADNPAPKNGVNPGETLSITLSLLAGLDFDDVLAALTNGLLRVGLHVQGIGETGGSESVINTPPVPLPPALPLLLAALGGLGWIARRQKRSNVMAA